VTDSAIQISYEGITVRCENERSQHQNKTLAMSILRARLLAREEEKTISAENRSRKTQVGSGMRGDKIRTIRVFADQVKDHRTGRKMKYTKYVRGFVELLYR
jgi:peptide chain release factor 1